MKTFFLNSWCRPWWQFWLWLSILLRAATMTPTRFWAFCHHQLITVYRLFLSFKVQHFLSLLIIKTQSNVLGTSIFSPNRPTVYYFAFSLLQIPSIAWRGLLLEFSYKQYNGHRTADWFIAMPNTLLIVSRLFYVISFKYHYFTNWYCINKYKFF